MRVHPILKWSYADVWNYLRQDVRPYCTLYDQVRSWWGAARGRVMVAQTGTLTQPAHAPQGYTSLGSVHDTLPNSLLKRADDTYAYVCMHGRRPLHLGGLSPPRKLIPRRLPPPDAGLPVTLSAADMSVRAE